MPDRWDMPEGLKAQYEADLKAMLRKVYDTRSSHDRKVVYLEHYEWDEYGKQFYCEGFWSEYRNNAGTVRFQPFSGRLDDLSEWLLRKDLRPLKQKKVVKVIERILFSRLAEALLEGNIEPFAEDG